ncbi:hypothetical protein G4B88_016948 [Cannabis sativa]|uniref:Morc S5 domain-containing protein n=1 Tax=Cannabis sativa TaxID=3483 RepID=A0A7J6FML3_CANSA|nr:hypothetical protein G4B88_016948 [Cannabis sativa]
MTPKSEKGAALVDGCTTDEEDDADTQPPSNAIATTTASDPSDLDYRSFWKAGSYAVNNTIKPPSSQDQLEHARVHPKFLHSNATSHKWAFGAVAELLDNAVDEIHSGATFVKVDKIDIMKDNTPALLFQDDGGGMDPESIRKCMSLGYSSKKTNTTIGQYGNGFKTSTMRLGADVIVLSRAVRGSQATQSVGLLSYTFLRKTGQDDVIVPMVDFDISSNWAEPIIYGSHDDWSSNLKTILEWSPFSSKEELMLQFEDIGAHGTKVIIYNLWLNDEGIYELNFDDDDEDIRLRDETTHGSSNQPRRRIAQMQSHISYRIRYSLRAYASILYLRKFSNFSIILRGKPVEQFNIADELQYPIIVSYRPQLGTVVAEAVDTKLGFIKEAPDLSVCGFNVYHKNRLIRPFWKVTADGSSKGSGVVGVLEANFIEPAHDKQDFERSSLFIRLETRLKQMVNDYWKVNCHHMGYQTPGTSVHKTQKDRPIQIKSSAGLTSNVEANQTSVGLPANVTHDLRNSLPPGFGPRTGVRSKLSSAHVETSAEGSKEVVDLVDAADEPEPDSIDQICEENVQLFLRCEEHVKKQTELKQMVGLEKHLEESKRKCIQLAAYVESKKKPNLSNPTSEKLRFSMESSGFCFEILNFADEKSLVNTMRKRDLAILMLSAFAIFFSLHHEGDFSFREAWMHLSDEYPIKFEGERLPPPIVADLNGDGKREVLLATHDAKIQILEPHSLRVDEGFSNARVIAEVSLLPDKVRVSSGRRAVAMATGVIDRQKPGKVVRQVLVVVTSGWTVMCFDSNLKKLWENNLQEDFPHNAHHREIAISVSNYTLKHGDSGLVIVGGRMEVQPHILLDPFEEMEAEKSSEQRGRSTTEKEGSENPGTADSRHFKFYAFAGGSGVIRWRGKNENVEGHSSDASQLIPQHNYKLDVQALNSRRPGEHECREFRESILGVMPHHWAVGGNGAEQTVVSGSMEVLRPCWAVATSGVPVREQLFNASICHHSPFNLFQHAEFSRHIGRNQDLASLEVATPILIPRDDGHRHRKGSHGDVVFLTNRGEVTSYAPGLHGHGADWQWHLSTAATWSNLPSPSGMMEAGTVIPTLKAFSLRVHDNRQVILAGGEQEAVVISPGGSILASIDLPAPPTHAIVCDDFSNDGLTDLILVTSTGVYGFVQTRQPGALFFSTLVGCLILVMGVIFVTQHLNSGKGKPRASSGSR